MACGEAKYRRRKALIEIESLASASFWLKKAGMAISRKRLRKAKKAAYVAENRDQRKARRSSSRQMKASAQKRRSVQSGGKCAEGDIKYLNENKAMANPAENLASEKRKTKAIIKIAGESVGCRNRENSAALIEAFEVISCNT
jgi:HD superfamily phosphohydrolase